jgi:hypothetical protein
MAFAGTTLKITGSTAFRKSLYAAIINQLGNGTVKVAYVASASGLASANQATFLNTTTGDCVQCCMAGSVGGVHWVSNLPTQINPAPSIDGSGNPTTSTTAWISAATVTASGTTASTTGDPATISGGFYLGTQSGIPAGDYDAAAPAQVCMSDSLQSSTPYAAGTNDAALTDPINATTGVGVVTFVWAKGQDYSDVDTASPGGYARFTNMTDLQFQELEANGSEPLSFFTGNPADHAVEVDLTGRDFDSGTRVSVFAQAFQGPFNASVNTPAIQMQGLNSTNADVGTGGAAPITQINAFATETSGYSSGGQVKTLLLASIAPTTVGFNGSPVILVGYLGTGDNPGSALDLTNSGIPFSATACEEGQYSWWTYEHMYYDNNRISTNQKTLASGIAGLINTTYADIAGLKNSSMNCSRSDEGVAIVPN